MQTNISCTLASFDLFRSRLDVGGEYLLQKTLSIDFFMLFVAHDSVHRSRYMKTEPDYNINSFNFAVFPLLFD